MIRVTGDARVARAYLQHLTRSELPKVIGRSLTRTGASGRTFSSRQFRKRINLKKAVIDKAIAVRRSNEIGSLSALNAGRAWVEIRWSGRPFPLRDFDARETRSGVTFKVAKRARRRVYMRQGRKAFIVASLGDHVFVRIGEDPPGPEKAKIKKVYGPSIPQFAATRREQRALIEHVREFWSKEVIRNAQFALRRRRA